MLCSTRHRLGIPPRPLSLEQALELIRERRVRSKVTLSFIRLRKVELSAQKRSPAASKKARGLAAAPISDQNHLNQRFRMSCWARRSTEGRPGQPLKPQQPNRGKKPLPWASRK